MLKMPEIHGNLEYIETLNSLSWNSCAGFPEFWKLSTFQTNGKGNCKQFECYFWKAVFRGHSWRPRARLGSTIFRYRIFPTYNYKYILFLGSIVSTSRKSSRFHENSPVARVLGLLPSPRTFPVDGSDLQTEVAKFLSIIYTSIRIFLWFLR